MRVNTRYINSTRGTSFDGRHSLRYYGERPCCTNPCSRTNERGRVFLSGNFFSFLIYFFIIPVGNSGHFTWVRHSSRKSICGCNIFVCPNNCMAASAWNFLCARRWMSEQLFPCVLSHWWVHFPRSVLYYAHRCRCMGLHTGVVWAL